MAPPTKKRGISHGISFSTTKITLKIPTFLRYGIVGEGILICVIVQTKGTVLLVCLWHIQTKRTVPLVCGLRQRLESATPHHQRRSPQRGRWHRQKDKNRSPSAKNQTR